MRPTIATLSRISNVLKRLLHEKEKSNRRRSSLFGRGITAVRSRVKYSVADPQLEAERRQRFLGLQEFYNSNECIYQDDWSPKFLYALNLLDEDLAHTEESNTNKEDQLETSGPGKYVFQLLNTILGDMSLNLDKHASNVIRGLVEAAMKYNNLGKVRSSDDGRARARAFKNSVRALRLALPLFYAASHLPQEDALPQFEPAPFRCQLLETLAVELYKLPPRSALRAVLVTELGTCLDLDPEYCEGLMLADRDETGMAAVELIGHIQVEQVNGADKSAAAAAP